MGTFHRHNDLYILSPKPIDHRKKTPQKTEKKFKKKSVNISLCSDLGCFYFVLSTQILFGQMGQHDFWKKCSVLNWWFPTSSFVQPQIVYLSVELLGPLVAIIMNYNWSIATFCDFWEIQLKSSQYWPLIVLHFKLPADHDKEANNLKCGLHYKWLSSPVLLTSPPVVFPALDIFHGHWWYPCSSAHRASPARQ